MIEIVKKGIIKYQKTCKECTCVFNFEAEDVTKETVWDDHGGHYPVCDFYYIFCPCCGHKIDVRDMKKLLEQEDGMKHIDS